MGLVKGRYLEHGDPFDVHRRNILKVWCPSQQLSIAKASWWLEYRTPYVVKQHSLMGIDGLVPLVAMVGLNQCLKLND